LTRTGRRDKIQVGIKVKSKAKIKAEVKENLKSLKGHILEKLI